MTTTQQPTISSAWDQASDGSFVATVRVSDLASAEQAKADLVRMRNALSEPKLPTQQPELPAPFARYRHEALYTEAQVIAHAQAAVLADRERRVLGGVVAWRYVPSETWKDYVLTSDPEQVKQAREAGCMVESLAVVMPAAPSKVEDKP